MTFLEWADNLELRASGGYRVSSPSTEPWRCYGCGMLMYGIERINGRSYPSPDNTPAGLFISKTYPRVCRVCWDMYHAVDTSSVYWQKVEATEIKKKKQLGSGGDYLFT